MRAVATNVNLDTGDLIVRTIALKTATDVPTLCSVQMVTLLYSISRSVILSISPYI